MSYQIVEGDWIFTLTLKDLTIRQGQNTLHLSPKSVDPRDLPAFVKGWVYAVRQTADW